GNEASAEFESFGLPDALLTGAAAVVPRSTYGSGGLLDYPHYTRPAEFRGIPIPDALMGGNHEVIRQWRRRMALEKTLRNRPELLERISLSDEDQEILDELRFLHGDIED